MGKIRLAFVFALTTLTAATAAPPPAKSPVSASSPADAKAAFLALSEDDRKALQDALGWLGFYNGVVDGAYGKRTIDALIAYQQSVAAPADGIAAAKQLAALKSASAKAKADVGFSLIDDAATGVRFGAPLKLLNKRESGAAYTSLASADGEIALTLKQTPGDLAALFKAQIAAPNRKVTYKYLKPDAFFVVAGEEGDKKFYRRYEAAEDGKSLRGFAFIYPKARAKALDPVALAVANAFDAFPTPAPAPSPTPSPSPTPELPRLTAVALIVRPGEAVTTLPPDQCKTATIQGEPARFLGGDGEGLVRLTGAFGEGVVAPALGEASDDLVALSVGPAADNKTVLQVASAAPAPGGGRRFIAALGPIATGAPLFDLQARLVAFVAPGETTKRRADVALAEPHATVSAASLGVGAPPDASAAPLSMFDIAAKMRGAVVGVFCGP